MEIFDFNQFRTILILEQDDPTAVAASPPPPPPSPAGDVPPPPPSSPGSQFPSTEPLIGGDQTGQTPPTAPTIQPFKFVFIQDAPHKKWYGVHDKDGGIKRFTVYEVVPDELEKWIEAHEHGEHADLIKAALSGKRHMPSSAYSYFKKEVINGSLGSDLGPIDIKFDSETDFDNPSTEDLEVVFLKSKK